MSTNTLLVIDMQNAWLDEHPRFDASNIMMRINHIADHFRQRSEKVVFIRHYCDEVPPSSDAFAVHPALVIDTQDLYVDKTACDPFDRTDLLEQLRRIGTTHLTICGLATEFCIDTAVRSSLSQGFDVTVIADAHTTGDRPHLSAESIIEHHNWVWKNFAAPRGRTIKVFASKDL